MSDLWQEEGVGSAGSAGYGNDDYWDEGEVSIDLSMQEIYDDPDSLDEDDEGWSGDGDEE